MLIFFNSLFLSLIGLSLTEDGTSIDNEGKRMLNKKTLVNFVTFKGVFDFKNRS